MVWDLTSKIWCSFFFSFFFFLAAFAVDPLYHQTSAQFDEGGAKGLLLNNLGVYSGCQVLFDSQEVPGKGMSCASQHSMSDTIDLSFASGLLLPLVCWFLCLFWSCVVIEIKVLIAINHFSIRRIHWTDGAEHASKGWNLTNPKDYSQPIWWR